MDLHRAYVIWDWNGTLLDDVDAALCALNRMLARRSRPALSREFYRAHFGFPVRPFYAQAGFDLAQEDWDAICTEYHTAIAAEPAQRLRADARTALEALRRHGVGQSILSALREDLLRRDVTAAGVADFFDALCGVDNLDGATKLSRGQDLVRRLNGDGAARNLFLVGDTLHDAEVAQQLGVQGILVAGGHQSAERLAAAGIPVVASLTDAVQRILQSPT